MMLSVSFFSEESYFMILFSYLDNFEYFGYQYLTENPDKAKSSLQKSGIRIMVYRVKFWESKKIRIIICRIIRSKLYVYMYI